MVTMLSMIAVIQRYVSRSGQITEYTSILHAVLFHCPFTIDIQPSVLIYWNTDKMNNSPKYHCSRNGITKKWLPCHITATTYLLCHIMAVADNSFCFWLIQMCNCQSRNRYDCFISGMVSGVLAMTASEVEWFTVCSLLLHQRCNGQWRVRFDRLSGVVVRIVLVITTSEV